MRKSTLMVLKWFFVLVLTVSSIVFFYHRFYTTLREDMTNEEKKDKLQSITQETNNLSDRINNAIMKSSLKSDETTKNALQQLENIEKSISLERQDMSKRNEERINELREPIEKRTEKQPIQEKGVFIEIV